jgi:hypothetical protein
VMLPNQFQYQERSVDWVRWVLDGGCLELGRIKRVVYL